MPKTKTDSENQEKFTISFTSKEEYEAVCKWIAEPRKEIIVCKTGFHAAKPYALRARKNARGALDALAFATADKQ